VSKPGALLLIAMGPECMLDDGDCDMVLGLMLMEQNGVVWADQWNERQS